MINRCFFVVLASTLLCRAYAGNDGLSETQDPAAGGPPMIVDDTGTVDRGHWEVVTAVEGDQDPDVTAINPTLDINYGATQTIQFNLVIPYDFQLSHGKSTESGFGDAELAVKYRFLGSSETGFSASIYPRVRFNTDTSSSKKGLVENGSDMSFPVSFQEVIGSFTIGGEVAYDARSNGSRQMTYGILSGYNLNDQAQILVEGVVNTLTNPNQHESFLNVGSRVRLNRHTHLLVSLGDSIDHFGGEKQLIYYIGLQTSY